MTSNKYPVWAIKRKDDDAEYPVNDHGYPGYDHAIWYWWKMKSGMTVYDNITWDAAMFLLERHHPDVYKRNHYSYHSPIKVLWERLDEKTWRVIKSLYGNHTVMATFTKLEKIENPESTYRWHRE